MPCIHVIPDATSVSHLYTLKCTAYAHTDRHYMYGNASFLFYFVVVLLLCCLLLVSLARCISTWPSQITWRLFFKKKKHLLCMWGGWVFFSSYFFLDSFVWLCEWNVWYVHLWTSCTPCLMWRVRSCIALVHMSAGASTCVGGGAKTRIVRVD